MSSPYDSIVKLNNGISVIFKYIFPVLIIIGNIGNLISFLIFLKKSWKKNVCVFYFKVLLLFNVCYIDSTMLGNALTFGFHTNPQDSNIAICKLFIYTSFLFVSISPNILVLASIDRLLISSQNVDTRLYSSKRLAYFLIGISTSFWVIFNIHAFILAEIQELFPSYTVCSTTSSVFYYNFVTYFYGLLNVVYCVLMIILCSFALKNIRHIKIVKRENRTNQVRSMTKKDFQLLRCLFVQDTVYICCSILTLVFYIYQTARTDQYQTLWGQTLMNFLNTIIVLLYDLYYCSSFFIFIIVSKAFRNELKRIIHKLIGKQVHLTREEDNRPEIIEANTIPTVLCS